MRKKRRGGGSREAARLPAGHQLRGRQNRRTWSLRKQPITAKDHANQSNSSLFLRIQSNFYTGNESGVNKLGSGSINSLLKIYIVIYSKSDVSVWLDPDAG